MIPIAEAFRLIKETVTPLSTETVPLSQAVGRVLASDIASDVDSPPHDKSVMDGYAIRSADIVSEGTELAVVETIVAGAWPEKSIGSGESARIMTGAPLPKGADAVIMIEQTESSSDDAVKINVDSVESGKHIMRKASSLSTGRTVFNAGHQVRPTDIGLLAEVGAHEVSVYKKPSIAVLPTGDELVSSAEIPGLGQIRNSNGPMLVAMNRGLGLEVNDLGIGRDNESDLQAAIERGLESDVLILSGGVSAGLLDLVPGILQKLGVRQVFHKVAVKPGKPLWFGVLEKDQSRTYVFGLPGNPVSSLVGFRVFVRTAINLMMNLPSPEPQSVKAELAVAHDVRGNRPTYWPGRWVSSATETRKVEPIGWQGSSDLRALGSAEVLIMLASEPSHHPAGEIVDVYQLAY